jgi:hypothetical protein
MAQETELVKSHPFPRSFRGSYYGPEPPTWDDDAAKFCFVNLDLETIYEIERQLGLFRHAGIIKQWALDNNFDDPPTILHTYKMNVRWPFVISISCIFHGKYTVSATVLS